MTPLVISILGITFVIVLLWIATWKKKETPSSQNIIPPAFVSLQSPEYRCSTKCFDCIHQKSQEHWMPSHGNPHMFGV